MTDPDLKELDDLLPADLVAIIEANREFFRALYTGIVDRRLEREGRIFPSSGQDVPN